MQPGLELFATKKQLRSHTFHRLSTPKLSAFKASLYYQPRVSVPHDQFLRPPKSAPVFRARTRVSSAGGYVDKNCSITTDRDGYSRIRVSMTHVAPHARNSIITLIIVAEPLPCITVVRNYTTTNIEATLVSLEARK